MTGGSGSDVFVIEESSFNLIHDFASGIDTIRLDATGMPALGASGEFTTNDERFHAGATAAEADDRVIWNASSGQLWYDADGSGSGAAVELLRCKPARSLWRRTSRSLTAARRHHRRAAGKPSTARAHRRH